MARRRKSKKLIFLTVAILGILWFLEQQNLKRSSTSHRESTPISTPSSSPPKSPSQADKGKENETNPQFSNKHPKDFDEAKRVLKSLYGQGKDFYCDCDYDLKSKQVIDPSSCGFKAHSSRGRRIEWEHVVPASIYGRKIKSWSEGDAACVDHGQMKRGRNCAREVSNVFRQMEADLYNLRPAVGELNRARANFSFGEVAGEARAFGACDFEVKNQLVEPRPAVRGDIARIYFYMDSRYPGFGILPAEQIALFEAWHREDPLDEEEIQRLEALEDVQGNSFFIGRLADLRKGRSSGGKKSPSHRL